MIISVASGKGGTGKTTVAVNLALALENSQLLDCDVEEPNVHIFLKPTIEETKPVYVPVPKIDEKLCDYCKKCSEFCEYNAIVVVAKKVMVFTELCHGCGGCVLVCPKKAITEEKRELGVIKKGFSGDLKVVYGELTVGEPRAVPVIDEVKKEASLDRIVVIDVPPGTSCPVVASINGSDYCILVTEPTPFGLHDLQLMVETVRKMNIKFGVLINKAGIGGNDVYEYCKKEGIPILLEIPFNKKIAELYSSGVPLIQGIPEWKNMFLNLFKTIEKSVKE
ncbi:(4Fe-4S)-binding protein [Candidatus Bathyarchaeota archaeon]|nr:MAG: (4Fe-4S)-binding protein [Candidatus Bathyarchaeota archaeon]